MADRIAIRNGKVVAWVDGAHQVLQRGTVIVEGSRIVSVGEDAPAAREIDAAGMVVLPGFVNMHSHSTDTAFTRDFLEESPGAKDYGNLYRVLPAVRNAIDARDACIGAKLLLLEACSGYDDIVELARPGTRRLGRPRQRARSPRSPSDSACAATAPPAAATGAATPQARSATTTT